ncbi:glutamine amidotransferase [Pseudomonas sp. 14P_8.1_Bac3]|uniref:glutamine amidotransferase n=1 Tax=Pseudomonas sp. 14P_8.1_Bac3 TaxID=2971621 RepID=UPI0021C9E66D|nr:glutamine amidotransferase [Pseudomonas sp. 14P_8.1_Bac3]MCU1762589.1 glutamine amidotransferase [Pseudomonas sp. 14P_8.1_Bac3]
MSRLPLIGVAICSRQMGLHAYHISGDRFLCAVASPAQGLSARFPALTKHVLPSDILDAADGTPITVTSFNIEPIHNSGLAITRRSARDSARPASAVRFGENTIACR